MTSAEEDVQKLVNAIVGYAYKLLAEHGSFRPFAGAMKPGGDIVGLTGQEEDDEATSNEELIETLRDGLRAGAQDGAYMATIIVYDVQLADGGESEMADAVAAAIDHRDGYSQLVFFPYALRDGQVTSGTPFAEEGERAVFG